jgi:hypothetical protein
LGPVRDRQQLLRRGDLQSRGFDQVAQIEVEVDEV